jgi:CRISPR-associated exonuclease Cas4
MEGYILISYLNDFIFCPRSIYFHQLYGELTTRLYHDRPQIEGKAAHTAIEEKRYSTRRKILQGIEIYCEKYGICGKIDLFDTEEGLLTERKKHIATIYDGYIFQLYAQYYGLTEMDYIVKNMRFYSCDDNKTYPVKLPYEDQIMQKAFEDTVSAINSCDLKNFVQTNSEKCRNCIYEPLCDQSLC